MENNQTAFLKGVKILAEEHFRSLRPYKSGFEVEHLYIKGYQDLLFHLESLINVCILALDNPHVGEHKQIREPQVHIQKVLELTAQLIPFEEAGFLDQMRELISTLEKED